MARNAHATADALASNTQETRPRIVRGAEDQAVAYEEWLAQWREDDSEEEERAWRLIRHNLQETRRNLDQRLLFQE